jgi:hypothetical protein
MKSKASFTGALGAEALAKAAIFLLDKDNILSLSS